MLHADVLGVERPHHVGQLGVAAREPHGRALGRGRHGLTEAGQHLLHAAELLVRRRDDLHTRAADLGLQRVGRALRHDAALVDDPDAVGEQVGLLQVLRGEEHGHAVVRGQALDLGPERAAALRVEPGGGLVEEEDARAVHQREREVEAPLHPAGVAADLAVRGLGQPHPRQQLVAAPDALRTRQAVQRGLKLHVLTPREERIEGGLLEGGSDGGPDLRAFLHHVMPRHAGAAGGGRQQRGEHVDGRGLAGPVGPEEPVDLAGGDSDVDAVHGARALLELAHQVGRLDRCDVAHGRRG